MHRKKLLIFLYIFICGVLLAGNAPAQVFSYVYIQGDKETPFYVKLEDEMQPRFGKDYCIISRLAPGPLTIQILFQQNKYPAQNFTFFVPENGSRSFLVTHNGGVFFLYDLQKHYYLVAGNKLSADHPRGDTTNPYMLSADMGNNENTINDNATPNNNNQPTEPIKKTETQAKAEPDATAASQNNSQPNFINNIVLNNEKIKDNSDDMITKPDENTTSTGIANSDCPNPMSEHTFDKLYMKMMQTSSSDRLSLLLANLKTCFSTDQVRLLAYNLSDDAEIYTFVKQVYPHVSDQSNYYTLEHLFKTEEGVSNFRHLINQ